MNTQKKALPDCLNPLCKEKHLIKFCQNTTAEKKKELLDQWYKKKEEMKPSGNLKKMTPDNFEDTQFTITLEKTLTIPAALDNGADATVMSATHLKQLEAENTFICIKQLPETIIFNTVSEV